VKWWWLAVVACVIVFNPYWKIENYKLVRITGASKADYVAGNSSAAASDSSGLPKVISVVGPLSRWVDDPDDKQEAVERPAYKAHPLDRIIPTPAAGANHFLHKTLVVPKYVITR
jgi:hypothetical protein